jgi:hypothetical protein
VIARSVLALAVVAAATPAFADEVADQLEDQADELDQLRRQVDRFRDELDAIAPVRRFLTAYLDVGFFVAGGDGSGVRHDVGHAVFPEYIGVVPAEWVLMGDPLSTAINARGEPADSGKARSLGPDLVDSEGRPAAIVNSLGLRVARDVTDALTLRAGVEILPRGAGVELDVKTARVEYRPPSLRGLLLAAGKVDSVLGIEYRAQDAPERLTVTPSLLCRYTCGFPVGVQARARRGATTAAMAITTGDTFSDLVEPDATVVSDSLPTVSARAARALPIGAGVELGVSGSIGPQDGPPDVASPQWHLGLDLHVRTRGHVELQAEYMEGRLPGASGMSLPDCELAPCLRYRGAYATAAWRARNWLLPYLRVDWRDALHQRGVDYAYVSKVARATFGARLDLMDRAMVKFEYTWNHELGRIPQFPDDVFATSIVVRTD